MSNSLNSINPELMPDLVHDVQLLAMIEQDEGFNGNLYKDSKNLNTIGIGFCLDRIVMPREVAMLWLDIIIDEILNDIGAGPHYAIFRTLDKYRRFAIINMCYQMGVTGVSEFTSMWKSLREGDFEGAARHALDSKWYREDTPNRAMKVAGVIRTGRLDAYNR